MCENCDIKEDQVLDVQGEGCPMPILKTKKALDKMNSGEILKILGTDPGTKNDLPAFCKRTGHVFLLGNLDTLAHIRH